MTRLRAWLTSSMHFLRVSHRSRSTLCCDGPRKREMTTLSINGDRLWQSLMDLAKIGARPKGGNARLAPTARDS